MSFTPIIPLELDGSIDTNILNLAEEVCIKSAMLKGTHNIFITNGIKELLRKTNSYYSNKIESEGTHPIDIDKAMNQDFSNDTRQRTLQILSIVHIDVQRSLEKVSNQFENPYSSDILLHIHKEFYSKEGMESFLKIEHENLKATMIPGELRHMNVAIGKHTAPDTKFIEHYLNEYQELYKRSLNQSKAIQLIHALCSHHRLVWIHPFLDGNGRVSRLFLDNILNKINIEGYGLWNISRGLSKREKKYKEYLALADMPAQGVTDGRGPLSKRGLTYFLKFMLETALDQVEYMGKHLQIDSLGANIDKYVRLSQEGLFDTESLPQYSELIFKELLISGEIERGRVQNIIGKKDRTATTLIGKLLQMQYLESDTPRGKLRLKFNSHFASRIIPELFPDK